MSWLQNLINQHAEMETPISFWKWAGLVSISAVVKDNVWISRGGAYNAYPNIYVILYADSGLKKGPATNLAKTLVREVNNTRIISGRSSIQGIMKKLGTTHTEPGGRLAHAKATAFIISSELSASLVADPAALDLLTDLYDRNYNADDWDHLLKMEEFKLKDPTITLFGGINHAHAEGFFDKKDVAGGFMARTFIIHETEENTSNSLARNLKNPPNKKIMAEYLKELSKLRGEFKSFDGGEDLTEVGQYYDNWYMEFRKELKEKKVKDETGTLNRFGDSVVKVAMLLSLSKKPVLEIDLDSLKEAIQLCEKFIGGIRKATHGKKGMSSLAQHRALIINEVMERDNNQISRTMLLHKYWMHFGAAELDEMMASFDQSGLIRTMNIGNQTIYQMPPVQVAKMRRYLEGKTE